VAVFLMYISMMLNLKQTLFLDDDEGLLKETIYDKDLSSSHTVLE